MREMFRDTGVEPALVEAALVSDDADDDKEVLTTRRWVGELACGLDWRPGAFNFPLPRAEHVNLVEYRALRTAVRHFFLRLCTSLVAGFFPQLRFLFF